MESRRRPAEIFFRGSEDLGVCSYERFTTQVQKCVDAEWEKRKEQRETEERNWTSLQDENADRQQEKENTVDRTDLELLREMLERKQQFLEKCRAIPGIYETDERIRKQKLEVAAVDAMICSMENSEEAPVAEKTDQPELPQLKNNEQRAAFIDAYETWPLWIDTQETGERYYRYDLPDGTSFVIKTYHAMLYDYNRSGCHYKEGYGENEQYLLEPGKFFRDCRTNRSMLIEKLKELQKNA